MYLRLGSGLVDSLPASAYHDPAVYEREREAIFRHHWWLIAREDQLPAAGRFVAGDVAGWPVFVIRRRDGGLSGFHNLCRHRAGPLVRGDDGSCDLLRCAYHGWVYDLEGGLRKAPGFDQDPGFDRGRFGLIKLRVECWQGLVFVCLDEAAPPLLDWLGDVVEIAAEFPTLGDMTFIREVTREGRANWKTYGDNSAEGYHLPLIHRELAKSTPSKAITIAPYERGQFVGFRVGYDPDRGQESRQGKGFWVYKFPGLLLHFSETGINLEQVVPRGPDGIRLVRWFWFLDPDPARCETAIRDSAAVMDEDLQICQEVQRNLAAGIYQIGRLSPETEAGTIYIQSLIRHALA